MASDDQVRLHLAEARLEDALRDIEETKKALQTVERQMRDARIIVLVLGLVGLIGGGLVTFVYSSVKDLTTKVADVQKTVSAAEARRNEYITAINSAAAAAERRVEQRATKAVETHAAAAVDQRLREYAGAVENVRAEIVAERARCIQTQRAETERLQSRMIADGAHVFLRTLAGTYVTAPNLGRNEGGHVRANSPNTSTDEDFVIIKRQ